MHRTQAVQTEIEFEPGRCSRGARAGRGRLQDRVRLGIGSRLRSLAFAGVMVGVLAGAVPAAASALTTTVGSPLMGSATPTLCNINLSCAFFNSMLPEAGAVAEVPYNGTIVRWREVGGVGPLAIQVLRVIGDGGTVVAQSALVTPASTAEQTFTTSLPVRAGDWIAILIPAGSNVGSIEAAGADFDGFEPALAVGESDALGLPGLGGSEWAFNADVVASAPTVTSLESSANPSQDTESVTFTATVSSASDNSTHPAGTVQFFAEGVSLGSAAVNSNGQATATFSNPNRVGPYYIRAQFTPTDTLTWDSSGNELAQTVLGPTTTTLTPSAEPSTYGGPLTLTATVETSPAVVWAKSGTVELESDGHTIATEYIEASTGKATFTITDQLAPGPHTLIARYLGDGPEAEPSSSSSSQQDVDGTTVTASTNPAVYGQPVTYTATVSTTESGSIGGSVQFEVDGVNEGAPVPVGPTSHKATFTPPEVMPAGAHTLSASYSGDGLTPAVGGPGLEQAIDSADTSTALQVSADPTVTGQEVVFTATVTPTSPGAGTPTGTIQFTEPGGEPIGPPVPLDANGQATIEASTGVAGMFTVDASYAGDANFNASAGSVNQQVNEAATTIVLASSPSPAAAGQPVTLTALVTPVPPGAGVPTGTVQFSQNGQPIGAPVPLDEAGGALLVTSSLTTGAHNISAAYSGDEGYGSSTQAITETINPGPTPAPSPSPSPPTPNNNFALLRTAVARDGTITFTESAPDPGTFTATAMTRSGHVANVHGAAAKCKPTRKHRCIVKVRRPTLYGTGSATTAAASVIQLIIKPNRKVRTALAQGKTLHPSVSITFQSARGGAPKTTITSVTVKGAKRNNPSPQVVARASLVLKQSQKLTVLAAVNRIFHEMTRTRLLREARV